MSFLTDINCSTVLEAIKNEKLKQKKSTEIEKNEEYVTVALYVNTFWTDLFANCFLCNETTGENAVKNTLTHDDMLFFVSRIAQDNNKIEVYRRDSKRLPCLTDLNYDWEETVYLNLILHEFEYTLTCAICSQTTSKDLEILKRHSKRVFASPSKRDLSSKGTEEIITYPNIYFIIDDFDEAFNEMVVNENEMVCVELVANDGKFRKVLFLGSIKYESLKKVYDARASTSSKLVQKVTLGSFPQKRVEFVKMKGPGGKGYAEMAVSRHQKYDLNSADPSLAPTPSEPSSSSSYYDPFQNFLKLSASFRKKAQSHNPSAASSVANSVVGTPEIESRDFRQDFMDNNNKAGNTFWNRTIGQAFSWINKPLQTDNDNYTDNNTDIQSSLKPNGTFSNQSSMPLNAYLTYVTLKLPLIMQDVLETRQKSLLTF